MERHSLEYYHLDPYTRGGYHSHENIQMMCPTHNAHMAYCGKEMMERYRRLANRRPATTFDDGRNRRLANL